LSIIPNKKISDISDNFNKIYLQAKKKAPHLETWKGHYLVRKTEAEILTNRFNFSKDYVGLELGCGNAFQTVLLASLSKKIFATDLFKKDNTIHSHGINRAKELIDKLNIENITLLSCSAVRLPFSDNYFDFVFSSSMLEHVNDKDAALREIRRVLKPNGYMISILPTHMASIYEFPRVFLYFLGRIFKFLLRTESNSDIKKGKDKEKYTELSLFKRFKKHHPSFPLPEPHGRYANIFEELRKQSPQIWKRSIEIADFKVIDIFPTCLVPCVLFEPFSTNVGSHLYSYSKKFHLYAPRWLSFLACLDCFIAVKNKN